MVTIVTTRFYFNLQPPVKLGFKGVKIVFILRHDMPYIEILMDIPTSGWQFCLQRRKQHTVCEKLVNFTFSSPDLNGNTNIKYDFTVSGQCIFPKQCIFLHPEKCFSPNSRIASGSTGPVLHFVETRWADTGIQQNSLTLFCNYSLIHKHRHHLNVPPFITASEEALTVFGLCVGSVIEDEAALRMFSDLDVPCQSE